MFTCKTIRKGSKGWSGMRAASINISEGGRGKIGGLAESGLMKWREKRAASNWVQDRRACCSEQRDQDAATAPGQDLNSCIFCTVAYLLSLDRDFNITAINLSFALSKLYFILSKSSHSSSHYCFVVHVELSSNVFILN